ncbi:MAG TPA: hypothetical protein VGO07_03765 [Candidatus Saccharimonadales bacterium]|jgi:hypothetical protein|nr:hypothetical protein [Candidatus Saccharimonadales bacterium]
MLDISGVTSAPGTPMKLTQTAWALIAIMLLLVIASVDPKVGGMLLVVVVFGMVYAANKKGLI